MARGRMLDRRFVESKKLTSVPRDARLAYASILPFLDREGRIIAEPIYLKAIVFRHSDFTLEEIGTAIRQVADVGLVRLYADEDNAAIIEYIDFTRFNSPNAKESKSDLPGPDDDGSVPCREPLIGIAPAKHVQSTGIASGERNGTERRTLTINDNPPPTPPTPEPPPQDDEVDRSLTLANKRRANKHTTAILAQQHPQAKHALDDLQSVYSWKPAQYAVVADTFLELVRDHGEARVANAATHVLASGATITHPIPYLKKLLADTPAPAPAKPKHDLDAIFGLEERPVN